MKKKQKEEEQERKAKEKARKAAEREEARINREAAKAEKAVARVKKTSELSLSGNKCSSPTNPRPSRKKVRSEFAAAVDADHWCVCFGSYQEDIDTGRDWLQCNCERWLHEDCSDDEDIDGSGKLCPLC